MRSAVGRMRTAFTFALGVPSALPSANFASSSNVIPSVDTSSTPAPSASPPFGSPVVTRIALTVAGVSKVSVK